MITDGTVKEALTGLDSLIIDSEKSGYRFSYKSQPTIASTNNDAFLLNGFSELVDREGVIYVDRVRVDKDISRFDLKEVLVAMLRALYSNPSMETTDIVQATFKRPGSYENYLSLIENQPDKFEIRLCAKGYPRTGEK
jgi:hypothetical protein